MTNEPPYEDLPPYVQISHHPEGFKIGIYLRPDHLAQLANTGYLEVMPNDDGGDAPTLHIADIPLNPGEHTLARLQINR